ncbi:MAG: hypothetical protein U1E84_09620 [Rhodoferax sp.]
MKTPLLTLFITAVCAQVAAATEFTNVPGPLQKALQGNAIQSARLDAGVLRLQVAKPEVTELVYASFVFHAICREQWINPQQFLQYGLQRVEMLNSDASQGFAFDARGDVCEQMGQLGKNFRTFISQYTVKCAAGTCPAPR